MSKTLPIGLRTAAPFAVLALLAVQGTAMAALPDLTISSYNRPSSTANEGDPFWIQAVFVNAGLAAAGSSHTKAYLSTDNDVDTSDDYYLGERGVSALPSGYHTNVTWNFTVPDLGSGTYDVWVVFIVDSQNEVTEEVEGYNNLIKTGTPAITVSDGGGGGTPDLAVTGLQVQGASVAEGSAFWVKQLIRNTGTAQAGASHARLYLSTDGDTDVSDDYSVGEIAVPTLAAATEYWAQFNFTMPNLGSGSYTVWTVCVVDSQGQVTELSESNTFKSAAGAFVAQDAGTAPTANFTFSPASPESGQQVTFTDTSTGSPTTWSWDFDDGWTSTAQNPTHTFSSPGSYTVSLTAGNTHGSNPISKQVTVTAGGGSYQYWVAVGIHWPGAQGSDWRTDLGLLNTTADTAHVTVVLHVGTSEKSDTADVAPHSQSILTDVVAQLGYSGSGSLEILSDQPLKVSSRTYTIETFGTLGQSYGPYTTAEGLGAGESAWLPQLTENSDYRTNIGITNTGTTPASVKVELFNGAGTVLATYTVNLVAGEWKQENRPYDTKAAHATVARGYARVTVLSGSGIIAYAAVADNDSNDPATITMQR